MRDTRLHLCIAINDSKYVVTEEFKDGYFVLARFDSVDEAQQFLASYAIDHPHPSITDN